MRSLCFLMLFTLAQAAHSVTSEPDVELHFALCDTSIETIFTKLGATGLVRKDRTVRYNDTHARDYFSQGLVVRDRSAKKGDETVVKIKVNSVGDISDRWFELENFKCEYDRTIQSLNLNCSLGGSSSLSRDQLDFIEAYGPSDFALSDLKSFGPARDTTWKNYETHGLALEFERYVFPDGDQRIEVSTRVKNRQADASLEKLRGLLAEHGVGLCVDQSSKTKLFFAHF